MQSYFRSKSISTTNSCPAILAHSSARTVGIDALSSKRHIYYRSFWSPYLVSNESGIRPYSVTARLGLTSSHSRTIFTTSTPPRELYPLWKYWYFVTCFVVKFVDKIRMQYNLHLKMDFHICAIQLYGNLRENHALYLHFQCHMVCKAVPKEISTIWDIIAWVYRTTDIVMWSNRIGNPIIENRVIGRINIHSFISNIAATLFVIPRGATL